MNSRRDAARRSASQAGSIETARGSSSASGAVVTACLIRSRVRTVESPLQSMVLESCVSDTCMMALLSFFRNQSVGPADNSVNKAEDAKPGPKVLVSE